MRWNDMKKGFLTVKEVAEQLQIAERTVYRYIEDGRIRATKIGAWRIEETDLRAFIAASTNIKPSKRSKKT